MPITEQRIWCDEILQIMYETFCV